NSYFSATASLLLYLDSNSTQVSGAVTKNTLATPSPVVTENLNVGDTITGTVKVVSNRNFVLRGFVNTSHGKVTTTVSQSVDFNNTQFFNITDTLFVQNIKQNSSVASTTTVTSPGQPVITRTNNFQFPLVLDISEVFHSNGNLNIITK